MAEKRQKKNEIEINVREILRIVRSRLSIIFLSTIILGLVAVVGTKLFIAPRYESTTKMYVLAKQDNSTLTSGDMQISSLLTKDYAELIKSRTVIEGVIAQLDLKMEYEDMLNVVTVMTSTDTRILSITVSDKDPYMAAQIVDAIRNAATEHIKAVMDTEAVSVVEYANIPSHPSGPNAWRNGAIGAFLGFFFSVILVVVLFLIDDTIKSSDDIERYLNISTLGMIPLADSKIKSRRRKSKKSSGQNKIHRHRR